MRILGLSAYYHDAAACLLIDGAIAAAAQEERFTRKKHDAAFPQHAIRSCLDVAGLRPDEIDHIVFYEKPFLKFERLLETSLAFAPRGFRSFVTALPVWLQGKLFQKMVILDALEATLGREIDWAPRLLFSEHHLSHAASAFFASPYEEAAVLTMDGVGEWTTTSVAVGKGRELDILREIRFPHSLGLLYSAFTSYTGFKVNSGEYKVMGLAPYGEPRYADLIKSHLIDIRDDGSFRLDMAYFNYATGLTMTNARFDRLFGGPARTPEAALTQRDMDLAASIQAVTEEVVIKLARSIRATTGQRNLCLAGGVALNCVANGRLLREALFDGIWVQPAAGDAGGALGAALAAHHLALARPRTVNPADAMHGSYLGPEYRQDDIEARLRTAGARFSTVSDDALIDITVQALTAGKAVGWHQGRMEFGPRALGGRSIIADPRSPSMQRQLNLMVKRRESFRPFAPSVLAEDVQDWFDIDVASPYMLMVAEVAGRRRLPVGEAERALVGIDRLDVPRSTIPAVTHVDCSARIQTVHRETNPRYHRLISAFKAATGYPVLVNTSFNVRGEPIVCTPEDAFRCLMDTGIELLVVGNCILRQEDQDATLCKDDSNTYERD
jgi:carbamoyltransferase